MTGGANFNEVFFNETRVHDRNRLGEVNDRWRVALGAGGGGGGSFARLREMVRHFGLGDDATVRQELMRIYTEQQVLQFSNRRAMDKIRAGQLPGPEMSVAKLALTENLRKTSAFVSRVLGPCLVADSGEWGTYTWSGFVLGMAIAGGSDETLRNIVGERVLGLPKEPGIDTTSPFKDIPKNGVTGR